MKNSKYHKKVMLSSMTLPKCQYADCRAVTRESSLKSDTVLNMINPIHSYPNVTPSPRHSNLSN